MKKSRMGSSHSISILVVDDDTTCLSFVAALLKKLKYEVVTAKHPNDALCALRIKGDAFDLVVSDVHMPDMNGFELQEAIKHEFNLPVVLMSVDSKEVVVSKGKKSGAAFFISKPVSQNDLKDLWQFASMRRKSSHVLNEGKNSNSKKKPKVIWTNALHCRFLEAIRTIGLHRSVPKKILEAMNVPGLTRENVASHLQKYRIFLKRVSDASYKLECGGDEGSSSNYSSSSSSTTTTNSLLMLNRLQSYGGLPAADPPRFARRTPPSTSLVDQFAGGLQEPDITTAAVNFDASTLGLNTTETPSFHSDHEWQNSIADLDQPPQLWGDDSCFVGDYQDDHLPAFDIMASQDQVNNQNLVQQNGSDYAASFIFYGGMSPSPYSDQPFYQQDQGSTDCVGFGIASQFNNIALESFNEHGRDGDDDFLESLLAYGPFGEDQIQTLEGI